jgi:fatty-acyl-CoA synthase
MTVSHLHGVTATPLSRDTIGTWLETASRRYGERDALVCRSRSIRYSYRQLHAEAGEIARGLMALDIRPGDRVGLWAGNCCEWVLLQYATAMIGAVLVSINPAYRVQELELVLRESGVTLLVASIKFAGTDLSPIVAGLRSTSGVRVVAIDSSSGRVGGEWSALRKAGSTIPGPVLRERQDRVSCDEPAVIVYTSGTTGSAKGATLSHHTVVNSGLFTGERLGYADTDRICLPISLSHVMGSILGNIAALTHGSAVVLPGEVFDPKQTLEAVQAERCTALYSVPTMFTRLLDYQTRHSPYDLNSLRLGLTGGARCPADLIRRAAEELHVTQMSVVYGMTEVPPVLVSAPETPLDLRVSTTGSIQPHMECKIVDPVRGVTLPCGVEGELWARGYGVMLGYWNDRAGTAAIVDQDGWIHTGDLAVNEPNGLVTVVGRRKEQINCAGEKVNPLEVEELLRRHGSVSEVAVVGVPDVEAGEQVCAWVRLRDDRVATAEELRAYCRDKIAPFKMPKHIWCISELPKTVSGKVRTAQLRQMALDTLRGTEAGATARGARGEVATVGIVAGPTTNAIG